MHTILELEDRAKFKHVSVLHRMLIINKGDEYIDSFKNIMTVTNVLYVPTKIRSLSKAAQIRMGFNALNKARDPKWKMRNTKKAERTHS